MQVLHRLHHWHVVFVRFELLVGKLSLGSHYGEDGPLHEVLNLLIRLASLPRFIIAWYERHAQKTHVSVYVVGALQRNLLLF